MRIAKETNLKMLHTVHLELYGIKKDQTIKTVNKGSCQGWGGTWEGRRGEHVEHRIFRTMKLFSMM